MAHVVKFYEIHTKTKLTWKKSMIRNRAFHLQRNNSYAYHSNRTNKLFIFYGRSALKTEYGNVIHL